MADTLRCAVTELYLHPIKGCRPISVDSLELNEFGVCGDRELMVVKDKRKMNLKDLPALAKITVERGDSGQLMLCAKGFDAIAHHRILQGDTGSVGFLFDTVDVVDQGDEIAQWLSRVVRESVRLVAIEKAFNRNLPGTALETVQGNPQHNFVDVAPVMVVNEATLNDLNSRISRPVPVQRFRPNIVVGGLEAYAEDDISSMQGAEFSFTLVSPCER